MEPKIEPMPPMTTTANTTMTSDEPISGVIWITRRRQHAGEGREADAGAVSRHHDQRHVDAEGLDQLRVLGRRAQGRAQPRALDDEPGA